MPSSGISLPDASDALAFDLIRYDQNAILQFREDNRFDEAFAFDPYAPDVLGIAAAKDGQILGMAGASADSPLFWQIGINVDSHAVGMHVGSTLVRLLAQDIIAQGAVPYYGTKHVTYCLPTGRPQSRICCGVGGIGCGGNKVNGKLREQ